MRKVLASFLLIFLSCVVQADSRLLASEPRRVCNEFITYCAFLQPLRDTIVHSVEGNFKIKEAYRIPGWHRSFHISPSGEHVVVGYSGLNLLPKSYSPDQVMLSIYQRGNLRHSVTLQKLFRSLNSLSRTASHYHWGSITDVSERSVYLNTVEGAISIELDTGKIHRHEKSEPRKAYPDEKIKDWRDVFGH